MNVLVAFENDLRNSMDLRALKIIFNVQSWKMHKKSLKDLVTLAWQMSPGMTKEPGSLNGPLCTYLIRQNLLIELLRGLRAMNVLAKFLICVCYFIASLMLYGSLSHMTTTSCREPSDQTGLLQIVILIFLVVGPQIDDGPNSSHYMASQSCSWY